MPLNLDDLKLYCPENADFEAIKAAAPLIPFDNTVCAFLNDFSKALIGDKDSRAYPDVITFAYFCRKANVQNLKEKYGDRLKDRLGRGVSFHVAPSNVPINFAYTLVAGLLAGNACMVRASSKDFKQTAIICNHFSKLLNTDAYKKLKDYVTVLSYPHDDDKNAYFSSFADIRVIWGGDNTIRELKRSALPPRGIDVAFADRYSIAVFDAKSIIAEANQKLFQDFYNDTFLYDQNACSAPRLIYWLGQREDVVKAKNLFWDGFYNYSKAKYEIKTVVSVDKKVVGYKMAMCRDGVKLFQRGNLIDIIDLEILTKDIVDFKCAGGSFVEYADTSLDALSKIVTDKYQTLAYFGLPKEELLEFVIGKQLHGIDRIVPIGKTADLDVTGWDGYDLIETMSRKIAVK